MQYIIFDVVIAALLLFTVWRGYKKGFILTLCGFLAIFVALIGASVVSNALDQPVSQVLRPAIETSIQKVVEDNMPTTPQLPAADDAGPEEDEAEPIGLNIQELLALLQESAMYRGFADAVQNALDDGLVAATANATRVIADYIALQVARIALFLIAFVLVLIVWFFLSHTLDLAFKLPVLSSLNHWAGAALGLLKGGLLLFIACWLLKGSFLPQAAIQGTYLLKFFCTVSPLSLLS